MSFYIDLQKQVNLIVNTRNDEVIIKACIILNNSLTNCHNCNITIPKILDGESYQDSLCNNCNPNTCRLWDWD